ncbi:carboxylesterase/lipase family protein [Cryptosporangium sp. NPDC048952]|uniref:carboxylesterase/lipase family protein n=1 Tax=Cryptosporangium sp. NPDC048952 TaxID=3363961 RepID=UPI00371D2D1C
MAQRDDHLRLRISSGFLVGKRVDDGVAAFLGIPYAQPPFGAHRLRPPVPVEAWEGDRDATTLGPTVPKGDYPPQYQPLFPEVVIPGEDCLNLNVWTPDPSADGLPVLVWIHGGSFMNGSNSIEEYDGARFARDGLVFVSVNYRLAAEGFLFLDDDTVPNRGLLDQVAALRWVQENIAAFGGDPARVTVAGESAGAMSITTLLAMPAAQGLFSQAITQSGAALHTITPEQGRMVSGLLAEIVGVPATREGFESVPLERLVQAASDLVVEVQTNADPAKWGTIAQTLLPFAPVVDGDVLPVHPLEAVSDVPLLTGWNRDEARLFLVAAQTIDLIDDATLALAAGGYGLPEDGIRYYRQAHATPGDALARVVGDWTFALPALAVADAHRGRTWVYRFDYPDPNANSNLGACHGVELPFVFDNLHCASVTPRVGGEPSQAVADRTHAIWVAFATDGDPGWPAYGPPERTIGLLGEKLEVAQDPVAAERRAWS